MFIYIGNIVNVVRGTEYRNSHSRETERAERQRTTLNVKCVWEYRVIKVEKPEEDDESVAYVWKERTAIYV